MIGASLGEEDGSAHKKGEQSSGERPQRSHRKFEQFWEDQVRQEQKRVQKLI